MKKLILIFGLLFTVSSSFISCRETESEGEEIEQEMDEMGDEVEEEVEEMDDDM